MSNNNPNKVNQYTDPDPRQALFLANYLDPESDTFSNAEQSAIRAGYTTEYAKVILSKDLDWLSDFVKDQDLIQKAEKNLNHFLTATRDEKVKADITKFVLSRLKKEKYSERKELTGKDGNAIQIEDLSEKSNEELTRLIQGGSSGTSKEGTS